MENILVTGGSGFIGSNFVHFILQDTDFTGRVINFDCLSYAGNPHNHEQIARAYPDQYVFYQGNICNPEEVAEALDTYQVDTVCHFAAESHVDRSIAAPHAFLETNVFGTFTLLEAARIRKDTIKRFHHVSTDEVYGSLGDEGEFTETTPYHPNNPYSASKAASDHLVQAYANTYRLPVTLSNCSNNYGPLQFPEKLIPLAVLHALEGKRIPIYGKGANVRDWLYVKDHCEAIWTILTNGALGETYNIGGNNELSNLYVVV
jgi:dTDP-glucose 4,6-dehydratase